VSPIPPRQFALFRVLLGALVLAQVASWWPFAGEIFAEDGLPALAPGGMAGVLPSPLPADAATVQVFLAALAVLAAALALGLARRAAALLLWYGLTCLGHAAPYSLTVASAFVSWLLLATALVPPGEPLRPLGRARPEGGRVPRALWIGAWVLMAAGYGLAGFDKLASPGWRSGDALGAAVGLPYAREAGASLILALPRPLQHAATWAGFAIELAFPCLALLRATRPIAWAAGVALQLGLLVLFAFPGLTTGMLLLHAFTFDPRWLPDRSTR
jgi:hypothetical protein